MPTTGGSGKGIVGRKVGMTQLFTDGGRQVAVTVVEAGPCVVVQQKTPERDGYAAIQVGFGEVKPRRVNRPLAGHFRQAGVNPRRHLVEFRWAAGAPAVGAEYGVEIFSAGERVDVVGISKGKGTAGVVKRHHARRGPMSHGSKYHRRVGSLNAGTTPARVFKNRQMPGRMGARRTTVRGLEVVRVDPERRLLLLKGAVPGVRGALVVIRTAGRAAQPAGS